MKLLWEDENYRDNISSKMKENWEDEDYRNNFINKMKKYWESDEGLKQKQYLSDLMLDIWNNKSDKDKLKTKNSMISGFYNWLNNGGREQLSEQLKERDSEMLRNLWEQDWYREKVLSSRANSKKYHEAQKKGIKAMLEAIKKNPDNWKANLSKSKKELFKNANEDELKHLSNFYDLDSQKRLAIKRMENRVVRRLINVWKTNSELALHSYHEPNKSPYIETYRKLYSDNSNILIQLIGLTKKDLVKLASKHYEQCYNHCIDKAKFHGVKDIIVKINKNKPLVTLDDFLNKSEQTKFIKYFHNLIRVCV